jgi:hypothetical protein
MARRTISGYQKEHSGLPYLFFVFLLLIVHLVNTDLFFWLCSSGVVVGMIDVQTQGASFDVHQDKTWSYIASLLVFFSKGYSPFNSRIGSSGRSWIEEEFVIVFISGKLVGMAGNKYVCTQLSLD